MKRHKYDPIDFIPSPPVARQLLEASRALTRRLEMLAVLSEQLHAVVEQSSNATESSVTGVLTCSL